MRVLVTGANGFVGKNLLVHLEERKDIDVVPFTRDNDIQTLPEILKSVDFIFHLAGVNRPPTNHDYMRGNTELTTALCDAITASGRCIPVLYTSSIQAELDNPYGVSKRHAEEVLTELYNKGNPVYLFRLPNVFGKWAKPNYNSAVATFCYNVVRGLPVQVNDPNALVNLVYIDDVINIFIETMKGKYLGHLFVEIDPVYRISVGELLGQLEAFRDSRLTLVSERVGTGLIRALYSTFVSYFPKEAFSYKVQKHEDPRGVFVEMLKTPDSGQFSFFTAYPGVTRGGHYHHSKTEKFLVIKGKACFRFRHIVSGEFYELRTDGTEPEIVETVPGWTHDITNIGEEEMIVMLWANEIFDRDKPDTFARPVGTEA